MTKRERENSVKIEIIAPSREKSSKDKGGEKNINKQDNIYNTTGDETVPSKTAIPT